MQTFIGEIKAVFRSESFAVELPLIAFPEKTKVAFKNIVLVHRSASWRQCRSGHGPYFWHRACASQNARTRDILSVIAKVSICVQDRCLFSVLERDSDVTLSYTDLRLIAVD